MNVSGSLWLVGHASAANDYCWWLVLLFFCSMDVIGASLLVGHASAASDE
jgi:hypothetical protein